ncbi:MAG: hypothetical protein AVDCRST_MAG36-2649, partial [uncultured Nocardioidaceae bacterium]
PRPRRLRRSRRATTTRSDSDREPRVVVPVPPPRQDPRRVDLPAPARHRLHLDLTPRTALHRRRDRHPTARL